MDYKKVKWTEPINMPEAYWDDLQKSKVKPESMTVTYYGEVVGVNGEYLIVACIDDKFRQVHFSKATRIRNYYE